MKLPVITKDRVVYGLLALVLLVLVSRETVWTHRVEELNAKVSEADSARLSMVEIARTLDTQLMQSRHETETVKAQAKAASSTSKKTRTVVNADGSRLEEAEEHAEQLEEHLLSVARDFEAIQLELEQKREVETALRMEAERKYEAERVARLAAEAKTSKSPWGMFGLGFALGAGTGYGASTLTR